MTNNNQNNNDELTFEQQTQEEQGICPKCGNTDLIKEIAYNGVSDYYKFSKDTNEWKQVDSNYWGDSLVTYSCGECGFHGED